MTVGAVGWPTHGIQYYPGWSASLSSSARSRGHTVRFLRRSYGDRLDLQARSPGKGLGRPQGPPHGIPLRLCPRVTRRGATRLDDLPRSPRRLSSPRLSARLLCGSVCSSSCTRSLRASYPSCSPSRWARSSRGRPARHPPHRERVVGGSWAMTPARGSLHVSCSTCFSSPRTSATASSLTPSSRRAATPAWPPTSAPSSSSSAQSERSSSSCTRCAPSRTTPATAYGVGGG